uniref:Small ribosomal subunit protein uS5c n=1 Tax=Wollemia nobilis TaxID=56998 RepID=A0A0C9S8D7_9CONI
MATSSICSTFSTLFISNSNCSKLFSISSPSLFTFPSRRSLPPTKLFFQCKSPMPTIALPVPRAYIRGFSEDEDDDEQEPEIFFKDEEEDDLKGLVDQEEEDEKMGYASSEVETPEKEEEEEEEKPKRRPVLVNIESIDTSAFEGVLSRKELEIAAAYEARYGPAWSGISLLGNDVDAAEKEMDAELAKEQKVKDDLEESVVQVRRVTKVRQGGRTISFRAIVVVGDKKGKVGVGVGNAMEVIAAVQKAAKDARRHVVTVPMTKSNSFPHRADGRYGAAKVMLRPAAAGSGVVAGGAVRIMLEMAGIQNALGKQLGSPNALNNARAVVDAISKMRFYREVSEMRGIPVEELWK